MLKTWKDFRKEVFNYAFQNKIPLNGQFELTARCNLHCKMCYVCKPLKDETAVSKELSAAQWIELAKQARDTGMLYVLLTGGEVFIRPDFREIYEGMMQLGLRVTIFSNGTLITPEIAKWLADIPPSSMEISLYGGSDETYKTVTGYKAFEMAVRGIDLLLNEGINLSLRTTVIKDNSGDLDKLVKIADERDLRLRYCFYISPRRGVYKEVDSTLRLSPYDITQYEMRASQAFSDYLGKMRRKYNLKEDYAADKPTEVNENDLEKIDQSNQVNREDPFRCSAGRSNFWITWDGGMTPCSIMENPVTRPLEAGFVTAWKDLLSLCESIPSCSECRQCSLQDICWACPARLKSETNTFDKPAKYLCEWAKYRKIYLNNK